MKALPNPSVPLLVKTFGIGDILQKGLQACLRHLKDVILVQIRCFS